MLLVLEIVFTIKAWRNGWGARALIPLGLGLAVLVGAVLVLSGADQTDLTSLTVPFALVDLAVTIAVTVMAFRAPARVSACAQTPVIAEARKAS